LLKMRTVSAQPLNVSLSSELEMESVAARRDGNGEGWGRWARGWSAAGHDVLRLDQARSGARGAGCSCMLPAGRAGRTACGAAARTRAQRLCFVAGGTGIGCASAQRWMHPHLPEGPSLLSTTFTSNARSSSILAPAASSPIITNILALFAKADMTVRGPARRRVAGT
jgi:hypothetical protein